MIKNEEEYEWQQTKNELAPLTYNNAIEYADSLRGKEIEALGYSSKDDLLTFISNQYTITECYIQK